MREDAEAEAEAGTSDAVAPDEPLGPPLDRAVEHLVLTLPPKERGCVLLKDVLDYSLEEIAELVDSTVGGVTAALHRGRAKLAATPAPTAARAQHGAVAVRSETAALLGHYVERFNRRDWDGLRELIAADARVRVADRFAGRLADSPYLGRYQRLTVPWRLVLADVDGEPVVVSQYADAGAEAGAWTSRAIVRLEVRDQRVVGITDYEHCAWMLPAARSVALTEPAFPDRGERRTTG